MADVPNIDFKAHGIDLYKDYFKKMDGLENEDGYISAQELYLFSSTDADGKKVHIDSIMQEQKFFKKYAGKDGKMTIKEFEKMCQDPVYRNEVAPKLGRGRLSDSSLFNTTIAHSANITYAIDVKTVAEKIQENTASLKTTGDKKGQTLRDMVELYPSPQLNMAIIGVAERIARTEQGDLDIDYVVNLTPDEIKQEADKLTKACFSEHRSFEEDLRLATDADAFRILAEEVSKIPRAD